MSEVKTTSLAAFASQLRSWRNQLGWTQLEAGEKLGYSASLVSGIETMDKTPTADFAARCDKAFSAPGTFATLQELVAREAYPAFFAPVVPFERDACLGQDRAPGHPGPREPADDLVRDR